MIIRLMLSLVVAIFGYAGAAQAAPFVFKGDVLQIEEALDTDGDYRIGERALIDVASGVSAHLRGTVSNMPGSPKGMVKLGGGLLRLSGPNTYRGGTVLLQGGMHVDGASALGRSTLFANTGTALRYSAGLGVENHMQIDAMDPADLLMPGTYEPVEPDPDYRDVLQWIVDDGQASQLGSLAGASGFVKRGTGLLAIDGDAVAYRGDITVAEGALVVNDVLGGAVQVGRNASLQGGGTVASARIASGGTLAPGSGSGGGNGGGNGGGKGGGKGGGNGVGRLTIDHDLVFDPGSRLLVDALPSGEADLVIVKGRAMLDGQVVALAAAGDWRPASEYTILQSADGLNATRFAGVETNLAFLTPGLIYDDNSVRLRLTRNDTSLDDVAETPEEKEVADAIDDKDGGTGPGYAGPDTQEPPLTQERVSSLEPEPDSAPAPEPATPGLYEELIGMDRTATRQALRQLVGGWSASIQSTLMDDSRFVREAVLEDATMDHRAWGRAYYSTRQRGEYDAVAADHRSVHGFVAGGSTRVRGSAAAGAFFGAQQSRMHSAWASSSGKNRGRMDSLHLGLNMTTQAHDWRFAVGASHTWHRVDARRVIAVGRLHDSLRSRYWASTTQAFSEVTWNAEHAMLRPFGRLAWVRGRADAFAEQGGPAALSVAATSQEVVVSTLGFRVLHLFQLSSSSASRLAVSGQAAWNHVGGNTRAFSQQRFSDQTNGRLFGSEGQPLARQAWALDLAAMWMAGGQTELALGYMSRFGRGLSEHGMRLGLAISIL